MAEDAAAVGEGVADRGAELPEDLAEGFFELFVDFDVLVVAEEAVGEVGELGHVGELRVVFPAGREGEVGAVLGWGGRFGRLVGGW